MEGWQEFAVIIGGAAAALTGLLFVAVSIRLDTIGPSQELRSRAAQTLTLFISVTVLGVLLSIPAQPRWVLGAELVLLALVGGASLLVLDQRAEVEHPRLRRALTRASPNIVTMALIGASGILVILGLEWGLYLDVVASVAALIGGVVSAWLFMMKSGQSAS
jgi:hypothetical protein